MTETAAAPHRDDDTVVQMLCLRNDELEAEKEALAAQLDRAEEERDALAARVSALVEWADSYIGTTGLYEAVESAREADTTSLARLRAEVLEEAGRYVRCEEDAALLRINAQEFRRQAEGEDHD